MKKKKQSIERPTIHEELKGFNIQINEFGQIISTLPVEKINTFLNENVEDKKLKSSDEEE
jgi:hypothetical protein